uniref:Protein kinase domain-containing protein n=1 Tax=Solanum lycopersicum TaxID=4081 RepID=A0A3Q7EX35_SOLLC
MFLSQLFILLLCIQSIIIFAATNIHENVAISCGASGNYPASDGRLWIGDSTFTSSFLHLTGKSIHSTVPHQAPDPYKSARMSRHQFTYQFSVKPGHKFIRLHFKPALYKGFIKSKPIFTVKTNQHTLLSDFIPTHAAGINYFKKEFCINVKESETLSITFIPSRKSEDTYAFVNAIEIVSMPSGLYFTPDGDQGVPVVGRNYRFYIDNSTALETIQRINVGGNSILSLEDSIMFRDWEDDTNYLIQVGAFSVNRAPKFSTISKHTNAILNGIEVFKISNPDNNLGSVSPVHLVTSSTPEKSEESVLFYTKNQIATVLTFMVTLVNVAVYYIRCISEMNSGKTNNRISSGEHQCRQFSLDEMERSTNNFDPQLIIGSGGYGPVYKGEIDGGETTVAVKRLKRGSSQGEREFWMEINMLSTHRHDNLLSLIGYCIEGHEMLLVYDYMPRGSLADNLYKMDRNCSSLSWERRLKIAMGAARGLDFLHTSQNRVIHRDMKTSNILLDENWESKISDFGLSKMGPGNESATHVSTQVKGTFGYLDPEYFQTNRLTWKTDVYAFGVVLFELLSGRPAVDMSLPEEQHGLVAWAKQCIREGEVNKLIDLNLAGPISSTCLKVFVGTAGKCLDDNPRERHPMSKVVKSLESALVFQQSADAGIIPFDDISTSQSKAEAERSSIKEGCNGIDIAKRSVISRRWWNFLGLFPKTPPKPIALPTSPQVLYCFTLSDILKATKDFHESLKIGFLGSDNAYVGFINGRRVSIRRSHTAESRLHMFSELQAKSEMSTLPSHINMVSSIGFCRNIKEMILVYDYAAGGTLHDFLRNPDRNPLSWKKRLEICIGAAEGLNYLRSILKITVLHCIFNSSYIFLDENLVAKVSEVSWSKIKGISTAGVIHEGGYLDSDYLRDANLTEKSYVYSFGLVLFEMLCTNEALEHWLNQGQVSLAQWIKTCFLTVTSHSIHPCLVGRISPDCFELFLDTAINCLHDEGNKRPSMNDIITNLKEALKLQEAAKIT